MPFPTRIEYEALIYALPQRYLNEIKASNLRLFSTSRSTARVEGEIQFANGLVLRVKEVVDFQTARITDYGYTVFRGAEKIRWYDPQPHPDDASLQPTFPHHYHQDPNIKHHRLPAQGITFTAPNLETLINDCLALGDLRGF